MGMMSEFKDFAVKGNVMDLAVGVIIGGAFGAIVTSFIGDLVMPVVGLATGGVDFANKFVALDGKTYATLAEAKKATAVLAYGSFLTTVFNFLILAFVIFMMVKAMNNWKKEAPAPPPPGPTKEQELLGQIRDLLAARKGAGA